MAEKQKNNTKLIAGIVGGVVALAVIIIAVVCLAGGSKPVLDDSFFVSTDTKYVLDVDSSMLGSDAPETVEGTKLVMEYSGDTINSLKFYMQFNSEDAAKAAYNEYKEASSDGSVELNGKYIVVEMPKDELGEMTASQFKTYMDLFYSSSDEE